MNEIFVGAIVLIGGLGLIIADMWRGKDKGEKRWIF